MPVTAQTAFPFAEAAPDMAAMAEAVASNDVRRVVSLLPRGHRAEIEAMRRRARAEVARSIDAMVLRLYQHDTRVGLAIQSVLTTTRTWLDGPRKRRGHLKRADSERQWGPMLVGNRLRVLMDSEPAVGELEPLPTREECKSGPRPCPRVSCRHHLGVEVGSRVGHPGVRELKGWDTDGRPTCSLDVAEDGEHGQEAVGALMGYRKQGIQIIEAEALAKVRAGFVALGLTAEDIQAAIDAMCTRGSADGPRPLDDEAEAPPARHVARQCIQCGRGFYALRQSKRATCGTGCQRVVHRENGRRGKAASRR